MDRYQRVLQLSDLSADKLSILFDKKILIIGVGGVGQHVSTYLATNGFKHIDIVDFDKVEISNLNRQILLKEKDIGLLKVDVVKRELLARNCELVINAFNLKVDKDNITDLVKGYDLVVDAVDNWPSKLVISEGCHQNHIPFIHIGVDGYKGQYCLFKEKSLKDILQDDVVNSPKDGVFGPVVGIVSSLASLHIIKYFFDEIDTDTLYYYNEHSIRGIKI